MTRIQLAPEVRAYMTDDQATAVLAGKAGPPVYECVTCRTPGDVRTDESSAVLWLGEDHMIVAWAHTRCAPSEVRPMEELAADGAASASPGLEDVTYASLAQLRTGIVPTITVQPGRSATMLTGPGDQLDEQLTRLREWGFADLDPTNPDPPAGPAGWTVRVDRGQLQSIGSSRTTWWTSQQPPVMPANWRTAAKAARQVLLLVVTPGSYDDADQIELADARTALRRAAAEGRLVGGLLPLRGTLS